MKGNNEKELMREERNVREDYNRLARAEMQLQAAKAEIVWAANSDFSTKFYMRSVKTYQNKKKIMAIDDMNGNTLTEEVRIEEEIIGYYRSLFTTSGSLTPDQKGRIEKLISARLSEIDIKEINLNPTRREVEEAMRDMGNGKSPCSDGIPVEFYKCNWKLIGEDVFQAVIHVFVTGYFLEALNATTISLIPKVSHPESIKDYRPIANKIRKFIANIIANRIRKFLPKLISLYRSAFVPGRQIVDSILLLQEHVQGYHKEEGKARMTLKIDLQKAYDRVEWE